MPQSTVVFILALLMGIQPVTTDLYLPALPAIAEGFGASMAQAQFTLSALLLSFGISQLIWGPLSDRYGRKPILLAGLSMYTFAGVGAAWADSIQLLITWRILQGLSMGAVVMCGRALVRDLYDPMDGAQVMSKGLTGLGVLACISPPLGGFLSDHISAKAALLAMAVFGVLSLFVVAVFFKESVRTQKPAGARAQKPGTQLVDDSEKPCLFDLFRPVVRIFLRAVCVFGVVVFRFYQAVWIFKRHVWVDHVWHVYPLHCGHIFVPLAATSWGHGANCRYCRGHFAFRGHVVGRAVAGGRSQCLGDFGAVLRDSGGARRAPALWPNGVDCAFWHGGRHSISGERLFNDGFGLCHGRLAESAYGWQRHAHGGGHVVLDGLYCCDCLVSSAKIWFKICLKPA